MSIARRFFSPGLRPRCRAAVLAASVWVAAPAALLPPALAQAPADDGYRPVRRTDPYAPSRVDAPRQFDAPGAYGEAADPRAFDAPAPLPARDGDAQVRGFPEPPEFGRAEVPGPPRPSVDALPGTPFFAETEYGARPDPGVPGAPGFGLPHRPEQTNRYGIWYRPKSFHAPNRAVYRPSPYRPRGFGNLFDRPCVPDRLDYTPYTVRDLPSRYGPTYYPKFRENTECLIRPTRAYDRGPHAENSTGGCRLGDDCRGGACPGCRPARKVQVSAPACQCEKCRRGH